MENPTNGYTANELLKIVDDDIDAYEESKDEDYKAREYIRGNQLDSETIKTLTDRGQPVQIYNVFDEYVNKKIKGYFASMKQQPVAKPTQEIDAVKAAVGSDLITFELYKNGWPKIRSKMIWELALPGLACLYQDVRDTGRKDEYGRSIYEIRIENVPSIEIYPDRLSTKTDFSDARRITRLKWVHVDDIREKFPDFDVDKLKSSVGDNYTTDDYMEFATRFRDVDDTSTIEENMYLLAHTVIKEWIGKENRWVSYYWCKDEIIDRKEIVYEFMEQPYILQKLFETDIPGYYGLMHDHFGTQDAINQAIQQIQLMISSIRAIVDPSAIPENMTLKEFKDLIFRGNALVPVKGGPASLMLDKLVSEVQNYYSSIDRYLDIIQRSIGINDAFMGFAPASSSGKKVQVQQQAAVVALEYFATPLADMTQKVGQNIIALAKQYYRAFQILRLTDKHTGDRYVELNKPMMRPVLINGHPIRDFAGNPITAPFIQIATDPETEELLIDDETGDYILEPATDPATSVAMGEYDIMVETGPSGIGEAAETENMMNLLQIGAGAMPPYTTLKTMAYLAREMKTPNAVEISQDLMRDANRLQQQSDASAEQQLNTQAIENAKGVQEIEQASGGLMQ